MRYDYTNDLYERYKDEFESMNIDKDLLKAVINENYSEFLFETEYFLTFNDDLVYQIINESERNTSIKDTRLSIICRSSYFPKKYYYSTKDDEERYFPFSEDFTEIYFSKDMVDIIKLKNGNLYIENIDNSIALVKVKMYTNIDKEIYYIFNTLEDVEDNIVNYIEKKFEERRIVPDVSISDIYCPESEKFKKEVYFGNDKLIYEMKYTIPDSLNEIYKETCTELGNDDYYVEKYEEDTSVFIKVLKKQKEV